MMKVLGYIFLAVILIGSGIALVETGVWNQFISWISTLYKA